MVMMISLANHHYATIHCVQQPPLLPVADGILLKEFAWLLFVEAPKLIPSFRLQNWTLNLFQWIRLIDRNHLLVYTRIRCQSRSTIVCQSAWIGLNCLYYLCAVYLHREDDFSSSKTHFGPRYINIDGVWLLTSILTFNQPAYMCM